MGETIKSDRLIIPVYINEKIVLDMLTSLDKGTQPFVVCDG